MVMTTTAPNASVFHAIADPTRRRILDLLMAGEMAATAIAEPFEMSQPAVSQHLKVLREVGLVTQQKVGRQRRYRLEPEQLRQVYDWIAHYERFWTDRLNKLGAYLDRQDDDPKEKD